MTEDEQIIARVRGLLLRAEQGLHPRAGRGGWPLLQEHLALWEFLHLRPGDLSELRAGRPRFEEELKTDPDYRRKKWLEAMIEGVDLFLDSTAVWVAEFGDPFHPEGIPPHRPREGRRYVVDPVLERILVLSTEVDLPDPGSFETGLDPEERDALAGAEPELRRLASEAIRSHRDLRLIEQEGRWPALLVDEVVLDEPWIRPVAREELEAELEGWGPSDPFTRLLEAGPIFQATYGEPGGGAEVTLWLAPEGRVSFAVSSYVTGCATVEEPGVRRVGRDPGRDSTTQERFEGMKREAAPAREREGADRLRRSGPGMVAVVEALRSSGIGCIQCGNRIRGIHAVRIREDGSAGLTCNLCIREMELDVSGPRFSIPPDPPARR